MMYRFREGEGSSGGGYYGDGPVIAIVTAKLIAKSLQPIVLSAYRYESEWRAHGLLASEHDLSPVWFRGRHLVVTLEDPEKDCVIESVRIGRYDFLMMPVHALVFAETAQRMAIDFPIKEPGVDVTFGLQSAVDQRLLIAVLGDVRV
jgi:hypothetical protein